MKKIFSAILSVLIFISGACLLCACGSQNIGSPRGSVTAQSIYIKQGEKESEFIIKTGSGDWLNYKTDGTYSFSETPSAEGFASSWAKFNFLAKITEESSVTDPEIYDETYVNAVTDFLDEKVIAANMVGVEGYLFINEYSKSCGDELYMEDIKAAYVGTVDKNGFNVAEEYSDGRLYFLYTGDCAVYERENCVYAYSYSTDTETLLFEDDEYHRPLQHGNAINVYYTGAYIFFERVRDCAGYSLVTYNLAEINGSFSAEICTRKVY